MVIAWTASGHTISFDRQWFSIKANDDIARKVSKACKTYKGG